MSNSPDMPEQGVLQQRFAQHVAGEQLELFGKHASAKWGSGEFATLTEAVVATIKHAGLAPEQVKRVIEFANQDAYLKEFRKEGGAHKVVHFPGGPANPTDVFNDLNDGGGGTVFDSGNGDYSLPPEKTASVTSYDDELLKQAFLSGGEEEYPFADPWAPAEEARSKIAAALDLVNDQLSGLEVCAYDLEEALYHQVKQAALGGASIGEVLQVLSHASPSEEHVKHAFSVLAPRLLQEQVFRDSDALGESIAKTASGRAVNTKHPAITIFSDYCEVVTKCAELQVARAELQEAHEDLTSFIMKEGKGGVIPTVMGAARKASDYVGPKAEQAAKFLGAGEDVAHAAGNVTSKAVKYSPLIAAGVGANEIRRHLKYSPTYQKAVGMTVPLSDAYQQREAEIAARYGRYPE